MKNTIFNIKTEEEFVSACLETFRYQYENVNVYREFVDFLKVDADKVDEVQKIPFLPIEAFKNHKVLDRTRKALDYFQSSGTTAIQTFSKHHIADFQLYEESIARSFQEFIGQPEDFIFLGLLPSYLERQHSSLIYMVDFLMRESARPENGYFLYNHSELLELLKKLQGKKVILFGVSFALLDFLDFCESKHAGILSQISTENFTVIETGGMKGRKTEMSKDALLQILQTGFGTTRIFSEYSMTELLSQAYSVGQNIYESPKWMRILIRNTEDPLSYIGPDRTGAINIIDLANRHSCSFIATKDLGRFSVENRGQISKIRFEVLGRMDHSDIRGCSLLVS